MEVNIVNLGERMIIFTSRIFFRELVPSHPNPPNNVLKLNENQVKVRNQSSLTHLTVHDLHLSNHKYSITLNVDRVVEKVKVVLCMDDKFTLMQWKILLSFIIFP